MDEFSLSTLIVTVVISSGLTGAISTFSTVKALHVHISYIRKELERLDASLARAHERISQHLEDREFPRPS
jgi:fluoride ion exporter CrcB/FEX